jgi:Flp pilus assembly protein TadD
MLAASLAAAISIVLSVSFEIFDPDLFQHLLVGKAIWLTHSVPHRHLWTWPSYGTPEVLQSWLFRALLWPFWSIGGVSGLFAWRWLTTLLAFGLAWATARRLGARGVTPLVVVALCALTYRQRSMVRPETLVVVLLALQLWILETRRQGGADRGAWLVVIACVWANAHLSYYLGLLVTLVFWLEELVSGRRAGRRGLGLVWLASIAVSFLNPFGARALWLPFDYYFSGRHELIYQVIGELKPVVWRVNLVNGLPLLFAGWPLLILGRALARRADRVEIALAAMFMTMMSFGQRFIGFYAVVAAVYVSRGLSEALGGLRRVATLPPAARAAIAAAACLTVGIPEWRAPEFPIGVRLLPLWYSEKACDFMAEHGVRGRSFNLFELAGYPLYRFWPERDRLPFMDIHQTGSREDRDACARFYGDPRVWAELDGRHRFDYALLSRRAGRDNVTLDALDADPAFALVFLDDVAALYVRKAGRLAPVAERFAYRLLPAGNRKIPALQALCASDSAARARLTAELRRANESSPRDAQTRSLLANVALMDNDVATARAQLERAIEVAPGTLRAHERLGILDLDQGRAAEALRAFRDERQWNGALRGLEYRTALAYRRLGNSRAAVEHLRRELRRYPDNRDAADTLAAISVP